MHFGYCAPLAEFLADDPNAIVGRLHQAVAEDGFSRIWSTQTVAWREEVVCLQEASQQLVAAAENALRSRPKDEDALKDEQLKKLKQKVGELVLDVDILREAAKGRPTDPTTSGE